MGKGKRWTVAPGDEHFKKFAIGAYGRDAWVCALEYMDHYRTFIDVGAHIGHFTFNGIRRFKHVVAIEPVILNYNCLCRNVTYYHEKMKRKPQVDLVHALCGASPSHGVEMWVVDPSNGENSGAWEFYVEPQPAPAKLVTTPVVTIDSLGIKNVDLIKIDTQGWEWRVLMGAQETLKRDRPVLIVETVREDTMDRGLIDQIIGLGYSVKALVQKNAIFMPAKGK